jgi:hypothetical protein
LTKLVATPILLRVRVFSVEKKGGEGKGGEGRGRERREKKAYAIGL